VGYLIALGALAAWCGWYFIACKWWPYGPCLRCIGHPGRNRGSNSRRWGNCKRCGGTGKRVRLGARLMHVVEEGK
jgi:hypothetical protein